MCLSDALEKALAGAYAIYCPSLIKESCPMSTSGGLQCKISHLFKLPMAAKEQWHCGTHPFPQVLVARREEGQWEANCDYI